MLMWMIILGGALLITLAGLCFLASRIRKFRWVQRIAGSRKRNQLFLSAALTASAAIAIGKLLGPINLFVIAIYLTMFWLLCDGIAFAARRFFPSLRDSRCYWAGILALALTVTYLSFGYYNDHNVRITEYTVCTEKKVTPLKIALISDVHIGTTFDGTGFGKHVDTINALHPDAVVIAGDFIDGSSPEADVREAIAQLSRIQAEHGIFFVYGNHDMNFFETGSSLSLSPEDFREAMADSGVTILEDSCVSLPGGYSILGRKDRIEASRKEIGALMQLVPPNSFIIDLNHQPNDYDAESKAGVDLVLSGHTHGGQLRLIRDVGLWIGANDFIYGCEKRGNTHFIVSSGISNWAMDFKTGCPSEIVIIFVNPE